MARKRDRSINPKVIWAQRIKWVAIVLACCLLAATGYLLKNYKGGEPDPPAYSPVSAASPAASASPVASPPHP